MHIYIYTCICIYILIENIIEIRTILFFINIENKISSPTITDIYAYTVGCKTLQYVDEISRIHIFRPRRAYKFDHA